MMIKPIRYCIAAGSAMTLAGTPMAVYGIEKVKQFLRVSTNDETLGVGQFAKGLIIPHVITFIGIGLVCYGLVLIIRAIVSHVDYRKQYAEDQG